MTSWEADNVINYLKTKSELNLIDTAKATADDNSILLVELLQPTKSDVLSYIDGLSEAPARWARVVVEEGAREEPHVANYMVGPLPLNEASLFLPLEYCYSSGRNYAVNPFANQLKLRTWALAFIDTTSDIVEFLLGTDESPYVHGDIDAYPRVNYIDGSALIIWIQFYRNGAISDARSLMPQGLYVQLNASTRDTSNWKVLQWYYNNTLYAKESSFRLALGFPNFKKNTLNLDGHWLDLEDFSSNPDRDLPSPTSIQPLGRRYKIDEAQNYISWMGFSFYMSTTSDTGLSLHNIRFNNEIIMYELGMQEALAHYAGDDPTQGGQEFLDSFLYMGMYMYELVPGYDCPSHATFLDSQSNFQKFGRTFRNSICVFEFTDEEPLQRHTADRRVTISRNTYLVVRWVSTVWNYDYTFDYIFYLDGTIEIKVRASGFIFGAFYTGPDTKAREDEYGFRVHDAVATSMHDHVINFKADLDVAGVNNTLVRIGVEPITTNYPWDGEETSPRNTMHLAEKVVEKEVGLDWPKNGSEILFILNEDEENQWSEKRGYRIMPSTGIGTPSHLTILNSTTLGKAARWAERDIWVSKRKDTEPKASSPLNALSQSDPIMDFSRYINSEDVVQEDL